MSLILEALRRSEAQRQLGRTPDVLTPMPVLRTEHAASSRRWWMVLLVAAVLVAGWMGWRSLRRSSAANDHPPMLQSSNPESSATGVGGNTIAANPQQATMTVEPNAGANTTPAGKPSSSSSVNVSPQTPASAAETQPEASVAVPRPSPPVETASIANAPVTTTDLTAAQVNASALPPTIALLPKQSAAIPTPMEAPSIPNAEALLPVNDLPTDERAALPALKVSMHVYAEVPADRFMIIDGARVGEGGRIGAHIVLVKIRKDGGVLDIDGHRVLLPRP